MTTVGPWVDDAVPIEYPTAISGADTKQFYTGEADSVTWGWTQFSETLGASTTKMGQAWSGTGIGGDGPTYGYQVGGINRGNDETDSAEWGVVWLTCILNAGPTVTDGTLPAGALDAPGVVGVEWEPTDVPVSRRVVVETYDLVPTPFLGRDFTVKLVDGLSSRYEPPFETAAAMNARPTVGVITTSLSGGDAIGSVSVSDGVDISSSAFAVSIIDPYTAVMDVSELGASALYHYPFRTLVYQSYAPRYRLIYATPPATFTPAPPARLSGRGDGLGPLGGPRRMDAPARSRQSGFHPGGFY